MGLRDAEIILGWILAFYGALIGIILVHEVGHLVAVLALGFRLILIRVGPFEYSEADGWSRKLRWNGILTGVVLLRAGSSAMEGIAWRMAVVVLAGPMANCLSAALVSLIFEQAGQRSALCGLFILGSLLLGFGNLWPWGGRRLKTDGYQFFWLVFSRQHRVQAAMRLTLGARLEEFRAAFAAGSYDVALERLEDIILAFTVLPELSKHTDSKQRFINLQSRMQAFLAGGTEESNELPVLPEVVGSMLDSRAAS